MTRGSRKPASDDARYVVGIDLGTTNCAVSYAELGGADTAIHSLNLAQVVAAGEVDAHAMLPSFLLLPSEHEVPRASVGLPWDAAPDAVVGAFARDRGAELPHRLVSSAKSWLSHSEVDRNEAILPWHADEEAADDTRKVSPVNASARYLAHIRAAWDDAMGVPLEEQEIFLTVPASFDAIARELTVAAAQAAGLADITLLEEPQAAFYSWLATAGERWRDHLRAGDVVVVCDIGGGTSDFSLIAVNDDGKGNLELERVAVGDHILLGGDNMDLALAHAVSARLGDAAKSLKGTQYNALVHACRRGKESLLSDAEKTEVAISILGRGSKLVGGTIRTSLLRSDVDGLLDGFFPRVELGARVVQRRALGLRELGLPYASDAAITRHLASFLTRHERRPTAILWNGGVMQGKVLRDRIADVITGWYGQPLPALAGTDLGLAVAHGAAYYGLVRQGRGIRIRGGTARSYYIGVESAMPAVPGFAPPIKALCVAPFGMEEGTSVELPREELGLVVGEATTFRFFASSVRKEDHPGALVDPEDAELVELAPVETNLPATEAHAAGDVVPVALSAHVTEVGTLELWSTARDGGRWKLEYSVRERE